MNAQVIKKKNNYYIQMEWYHNGERQTRSVSVRKELQLDRPAEAREAKALRDKLMVEHRQGTYVLPSHTPFKDYVREWLENYKHSIKVTTYESYLSFVDHHIIPELGEHTLHTLRPSHIKTMYNKKLKAGRADGKPGGLSNRSIRYIHTILQLCLSQALEDELVTRNVASVVTPPKLIKPSISYWSWEHAKQFLEYVKNDRYYLYYLIALSTGMARGEVLGLRWQDINYNKQTVSIKQTVVHTSAGPLLQESTKTENRKRTLDISQSIITALKEHRMRQSYEIVALEQTSHPGLVFTTSNGTVLSPRNMDRALSGAIDRYNRHHKEQIPKLSSHGLRHTYATHLLEEGIHPKVVQERLGHSSIRITLDTYSHVAPRLHREVAMLTDDLLV